MSRSIRLFLAVLFSLAGFNLAKSQDTPAASASDTSAPAADDMATLQAENATLKKEVAVQAQTISELQAELAKAGIHNQAAADAAAQTQTGAAAGTTPDASASTNAAPAGPLKALPLDATNANATAATPGAPGADAGPSKTYTVVKGDSLWKIAHKMYPHDTAGGEDKIRDANKDVFNGKYLKPGQVLIIPQ
jgi:nucleoid-associated protein YgaU